MKIIDSTVLIDILRGEQEAIEFIQNQEGLFTTQINMYEIIQGLLLQNITTRKMREAEELFEFIRVLPLDDAGTIKSAEICANLTKKGMMIGDIDCLIAGIAKRNNIFTIVTKNKKHFERIDGIKVEVY